jgi:hypothetical protein
METVRVRVRVRRACLPQVTFPHTSVHIASALCGVEL